MSVDVPDDRVGITDLLAVIEVYLDKEAVKSVYDAYLFGAEAHEHQTRKSGEPYIFHPLAVALILANMQMDSHTLIAALLHDVIEDTGVTRAELKELFGEDVAHMVDGVSKISQITSDDRLKAEADSFRKMLMAMAKDVRVILIKLADRLHNMHTLVHLPQAKRERIAKQTLEIYAPIANRLGMREFAADFEDLGLRALHPIRYKAIADKLELDTRGRKPIEKLICDTIQAKFIKQGVDDASVKGREKRVYSIYHKIQRRKVSMKSQMDIHGIRIIVKDRPQCYMALGLVHEAYIPMPHTVKDYIGSPKSNGYQSLHTVVIGPHGVPVEVQIRTEGMDRIAEVGMASHWAYKSAKKDSKPPQQIVQKWLDGFLDMQKPVGDSGHFMEHLRAEMYPDKLFVFTPKGEIMHLPVGATIVDFAYAVHSGVGNQCIGAQVNDEMHPLNTVLESGDRVKIITGRDGHPLPTWLNFVVTAKARTAIRHYLHKQKDKEAISMGRRLLTKALRDCGFKGKHIATEDKLHILKLFELQDWNSLLADIGLGNRLPLIVAQQLITMTRIDVEPLAQSEKSSLSIRGAEKMLINYATCCYPIPGDNIVGVFAAGKGMAVHRDECNNTKRYRKHMDRWLNLNWAEKHNTHFKSKLLIQARHIPGVLASITQTVAHYKSNILHVNIDENDVNYVAIDIDLEVKDMAHLKSIIAVLEEDEHLRSVERISA
ncbi:MAG: guanosine-3',5'-bis(diphosphate) 3'-pyrophosphohydrolase [Saprospiraceae bacterium]|jgi:guanosine-3',5'-bis(diphosphate) 3'-pyrophosphohydrolase